jgi:hypothetical protein
MKYCNESRGRGMFYVQEQEERQTGIGNILRRNCLLKHDIEGKMEGRKEMTIRRGSRRKQLLSDIKEEAGYWKLKAKALDPILWISGRERGYEPVCKDRQRYE